MVILSLEQSEYLKEILESEDNAEMEEFLEFAEEYGIEEEIIERLNRMDDEDVIELCQERDLWRSNR